MKSKTVTMSKKGLVYIPMEFQIALGIKKPAKVKMSIRNDNIEIEAVKGLDSYAGALKKQAGKQIWKRARQAFESDYEKR